MKQLFVVVVLAIVSINVTASESHSKYDPALCKVFQNKIKTYEKKMRDDSYARTTLESYKKRAKIYCTK
ncbi:hypothetical protein [Sulfurimonas sp. C5]|uniref:hypothetical protein n=1 Tax=Sulfurimonas sp. C5 TaxID=3036947 RepID=UPI002453BC77|nr:hypothetical protein [Sulfurimonas sp. C5]MDH4944775.1 hypothetical protein [Sulfurimonas sp. C5]